MEIIFQLHFFVCFIILNIYNYINNNSQQNVNSTEKKNI